MCVVHVARFDVLPAHCRQSLSLSEKKSIREKRDKITVYKFSMIHENTSFASAVIWNSALKLLTLFMPLAGEN